MLHNQTGACWSELCASEWQRGTFGTSTLRFVSTRSSFWGPWKKIHSFWCLEVDVMWQSTWFGQVLDWRFVFKNTHLPVEFWGDCFETDSNSLGCLSPTVTSETAVPICIWGLSAPNCGLKTNCTISEPVGISLSVYFDETVRGCGSDPCWQELRLWSCWVVLTLEMIETNQDQDSVAFVGLTDPETTLPNF